MSRPDLLSETVARTTPSLDGLSARRARRRDRLETAALLAVIGGGLWLLFGGWL